MANRKLIGVGLTAGVAALGYMAYGRSGPKNVSAGFMKLDGEGSFSVEEPSYLGGKVRVVVILKFGPIISNSTSFVL
ncbi:unnamed protein product [Notodromas monacha]|uniref:Uncharacterized protein n=1 Tax=Notodromas monacha TaxID=399045 RepID=A0A7R9BM87_9CRUS|nr:unnamed protein product [Notodromas monacha]CAG0918087.1 unnamed protein product [Notodromas monacha]